MDRLGETVVQCSDGGYEIRMGRRSFESCRGHAARWTQPIDWGYCTRQTRPPLKAAPHEPCVDERRRPILGCANSANRAQVLIALGATLSGGYGMPTRQFR